MDDAPGVTRDRNFGQMEWSGIPFQLVDTGGYLPGSPDVFLSGIREQVQQALQESDLLLFVTDVQDGVTSIDQEIAEMLLKADRHLVLAVNKADSPKQEESIYDFYSLGLGEPLPVSAEAGRGVGDLLDKIIEKLPRKASGEDENGVVNVAVVGKPNVGKSSFVNVLLGENRVMVTEIAGTTRDAIDSRFRAFGHNFILIDTAGIRKRSRVKDNVEYYSVVRSMRSIDRSDITIVLIDAIDDFTHQDKAVVAEVVAHKKGVVLAVNKWDLIEKSEKTLQTYEMNLREQLGNLAYIPIMMISCKHNLRVHQVIQVGFSVYKERNKRIPTSQINDALGGILRDSPPLVKDARPIKVHYITQVGTSPPVFALFTNRPRAIATNYRRFLERKIRENFGFMGVPITFVARKK